MEIDRPVFDVRSRHLLTAITACLCVSGCGGGGVGLFGSSLTCTPAPVISSNPTTAASVGTQYVYAINAKHLCGGVLPLPCANVDAIRLPDGAVLSDTQAPYITWTPTPSQASAGAFFEIATKPDPCGARASQSWTVHVIPDTATPSVAAVSPAAAAIDVALNSSINVTFSEPIDAASLGETTFVVTGAGGPVAGRIALFSTTATFTPQAALPALSTVSVILTAGIRDLSGNPLTPSYAWTFVTAPHSPGSP